MKEHVKYARARDQLYHLKVAFRQLEEGITAQHRTKELSQTLDILRTVIEQSCNAFEGGHILEVLINEYIPTALPGFEELMELENERRKWDTE